MKKEKMLPEDSTNTAKAIEKPNFSLIDENFLKSRIYTIRGVKVMLDADLAEIYGYETRFFNRQIKNNIERFAEDFRFQLTEKELQNLMCKKKMHIKLGRSKKTTIRLHRAGHLHAHDCVERRFGDTTKYGSYPPFQADEGLHCGGECTGRFCRDSRLGDTNEPKHKGYRPLFENLLQDEK